MITQDRTKQTKVKLKLDDEVLVIAGKEKGKRGKILALNKVKNRVIVQGVNMIVRYQKPTQENPKPSKIQTESPIHLSNVAYYDSKTKSGKRIGYIIDATGKKMRAYRSKKNLVEIKDKVKEDSK